MIELESLEMNILGSLQDDPESLCGLESPIPATTVLIACTHGGTRESTDYDEILD